MDDGSEQSMRRFRVKLVAAIAVLFANSFATAFAQFGEDGKPPLGFILNPLPAGAVTALGGRKNPAPVVSHRHVKYPMHTAPEFTAPPMHQYPASPYPEMPYAGAPAPSMPSAPIPDSTQFESPMPAQVYPGSPYPAPAYSHRAEPYTGGNCAPYGGTCAPGYGGFDPLLHRSADCRDNRCSWRHCWLKTCYYPIPAYSVPNYGYHPTAWGQIHNGGAPSNLPVPARYKSKAPDSGSTEKKETETAEPKLEQAPQTEPESPKPAEPPPANPPAEPTVPTPPQPQALQLPEVEAGLAPYPAKGMESPKTIPSKTPYEPAAPRLEPPADEAENFLPPIPVQTPLTSGSKRQAELSKSNSEEDDAAFPSVSSEESNGESTKQPDNATPAKTQPEEEADEPMLEEAPSRSIPKAAPTLEELQTNNNEAQPKRTGRKPAEVQNRSRRTSDAAVTPAAGNLAYSSKTRVRASESTPTTGKLPQADAVTR